jgi:hypothetical protein
LHKRWFYPSPSVGIQICAHFLPDVHNLKTSNNKTTKNNMLKSVKWRLFLHTTLYTIILKKFPAQAQNVNQQGANSSQPFQHQPRNMHRKKRRRHISLKPDATAALRTTDSQSQFADKRHHNVPATDHLTSLRTKFTALVLRFGWDTKQNWSPTHYHTHTARMVYAYFSIRPII